MNQLIQWRGYQFEWSEEDHDTHSGVPISAGWTITKPAPRSYEDMYSSRPPRDEWIGFCPGACDAAGLAAAKKMFRERMGEKAKAKKAEAARLRRLSV